MNFARRFSESFSSSIILPEFSSTRNCSHFLYSSSSFLRCSSSSLASTSCSFASSSFWRSSSSSIFFKRSSSNFFCASIAWRCPFLSHLLLCLLFALASLFDGISLSPDLVFFIIVVFLDSVLLIGSRTDISLLHLLWRRNYRHFVFTLDNQEVVAE